MLPWSGLGPRAEKPQTLADYFERLDARELDSVRRYVRHMERRTLRVAALVLNRLSNGILYPIVAVLTLTILGPAMLAAVLVAASSVLVAHLIYPLIKNHCARTRPFECDPSIASLLKPLDRHSFPSGHAMTATAAFLPLSAAVPMLTPIAVIAVALIGWARLAAGHHYPSDVFAGAMLGSVVAIPGFIWLFN